MKTTFLLLFTALAFQLNAQNKPTDILGKWNAPNGDSHMEIYQSNGLFFGKVLWGTGGATTDVNNPDPALRNREVIGLVILQNFKFDGSYKWVNGTIYDPRNGQTYRCEMWLSDGASLNIRGYVGISLFGRTEIWKRL